MIEGQLTQSTPTPDALISLFGSFPPGLPQQREV